MNKEGGPWNKSKVIPLVHREISAPVGNKKESIQPKLQNCRFLVLKQHAYLLISKK